MLHLNCVSMLRPFSPASKLHLSSSQRRPVRRRFESPGVYSDDDANSDASSACSERSCGSRNGGMAPHFLRQTEDVAEVLNHCASANWSERKEGLLGLQNLFRSQRMLRWVCMRVQEPDQQLDQNQSVVPWSHPVLQSVFFQSGKVSRC